ncbi:hypothetical protein HMN09_00483200 [Mycena chlorophos]|uniref:Uncharacterized protein n=1 Tax=Mycena chlorophos TaxID=658473 RepID=A0A8H6TH70_MYCCL|nr:hypothetical protein HMN09_00483200 [Mycena chlorophos]
MATAPPKALSTSTLSLRFMQNAALRKGATASELDKATVKDDVDGEWEIPGRAAWAAAAEAAGVGAGAAGGKMGGRTGEVRHEASYMPFLFGDDGDGDGVVKGRRTFKKGREVDGTTAPVPTADVDMLPDADTPSTSAKPLKTRPAGKLRAISSQGKPTLPLGRKDKGKKPQGSARDAVFGANERTGIDLRDEKKPKPTPAPATFLRPAGVDAPPPAPAPVSTPSEADSSSTRTKKQKTKPKTKRPREEEADDGDADIEEDGDGGKGATDESGTKPKKPKKKKKKMKASAETDAGEDS